jgi:hypothetical protein
MARYWTWTELKTKVEKDLDLEDETFITSAEMLEYANEAIDECEAEIHSLNEDYFLSSTTITLVSGTDEYALPSDIYANKIRSIQYRNGSLVQEVPRLRDWKKLANYTANLTTSASTGAYRYFIVNRTAGAPRIVFTPPVVESGAYITAWYLRNANRLTADASTCDIPEFANFILQHIKVRCYEKEGHPNLMKAMADLERERERMNATLQTMVQDQENEIEPDLSHYEDAV